MTGLSPAVAIAVAVGLVALSAFFVAVEFALVAARRYRLEEAAETSAAARAALRSARELSLLLAGSQLGITLCTLGLGAVAKPAVHDLLLPVFTAWGLPAVTADVVAFVVALVVVTFVHLVIGEMAPKSWAIAHPERSAILLALPMRAFMAVTRPLLVALNALANVCLRRVGVEPVDEVAAGQDPDGLRELVAHSAETGTLDRERHDRLVTALELDSRDAGLAGPAARRGEHGGGRRGRRRDPRDHPPYRAPAAGGARRGAARRGGARPRRARRPGPGAGSQPHAAGADPVRGRAGLRGAAHDARAAQPPHVGPRRQRAGRLLTMQDLLDRLLPEPAARASGVPASA